METNPDNLVDSKGGVMMPKPASTKKNNRHRCDLPALDYRDQPRLHIPPYSSMWEIDRAKANHKKNLEAWEEEKRAARQYRGLVAYRAPCCGMLYRPIYQYADYYGGSWEWKRIGKWRLRQMKKKGLIPS